LVGKRGRLSSVKAGKTVGKGRRETGCISLSVKLDAGEIHSLNAPPRKKKYGKHVNPVALFSCGDERQGKDELPKRWGEGAERRKRGENARLFSRGNREMGETCFTHFCDDRMGGGKSLPLSGSFEKGGAQSVYFLAEEEGGGSRGAMPQRNERKGD